MKNIWNWLMGKKTYIGLAIGAFAVVANKAGVPMPPGVQLDNQAFLSDLWTLAVAAAVRHGMTTGA